MKNRPVTKELYGPSAYSEGQNVAYKRIDHCLCVALMFSGNNQLFFFLTVTSFFMPMCIWHNTQEVKIQVGIRISTKKHPNFMVCMCLSLDLGKNLGIRGILNISLNFTGN